MTPRPGIALVAIVAALTAWTGVSAAGTARRAARIYVSALTHGHARTVCHYLAIGPRRELIREAGGHGASLRSCVKAARRVLPKRLKHVRIVKVRRHGRRATVTLAAPRNSDSFTDTFRMRLRDERWRVLDL